MLYIPEQVMEYMDLVPGILLHVPLDVLEQKPVSLIAPFRMTTLYRITLQELYVQVQQVHFINNLAHINIIIRVKT